MGHHHHFHIGHVFHEVEHVAEHVVGGVVGEIVGVAMNGVSAVEDFRHHHDLAGVVSGAKAVIGGAELLGL